MYTLSLQREDPTPAGSNAGVMTIGGLPSGISNDSLTWVPVRQYPSQISVFSDQNIIYGVYQNLSAGVVADAVSIMPLAPLQWEVPIDGLYFNGQLLTNSSTNTTLTDQVGLTASFDSGNSNLVGQDYQYICGWAFLMISTPDHPAE